MAALSQEGRLPPFLTELARDDELDEQTKGTVAELAGDTAFLLAVADYLRPKPARALTGYTDPPPPPPRARSGD